MNEDYVHTARYEREMSDLRTIVASTQQQAAAAAQQLAGHEQVCALRYQTITTQLADVPRIFDAISLLNKHSNMQAGMWKTVIGLSIILGIASLIGTIIYTFGKIVAGA
jgi:hypothetical protein